MVDIACLSRETASASVREKGESVDVESDGSDERVSCSIDTFILAYSHTRRTYVVRICPSI